MVFQDTLLMFGINVKDSNILTEIRWDLVNRRIAQKGKEDNTTGKKVPAIPKTDGSTHLEIGGHVEESLLALDLDFALRKHKPRAQPRDNGRRAATQPVVMRGA
jgi:hypothetical protein